MGLFGPERDNHVALGWKEWNWLFLDSAAGCLPSRELRSAADRVYEGIVEEVLAGRALICGTPLGVEDAGLMMGLSGVGLGIMSNLRRSKVPCMMTLGGVIS